MRIELLHCDHQSYNPFLNSIFQGQPISGIIHGDPHYIFQIGSYKTFRSIKIALILQTDCEFIFFLFGEMGNLFELIYKFTNSMMCMTMDNAS